MDQMQWEKSLRESKYRHQRKNPSFSSSLLDEIYRSIDEGDHHEGREEEEELVSYRETMKKKQSKREDEMESFRRECLIENWMEKKVISEKVVVRRNSDTDFNQQKLQKTQSRSSMIFNSTSSSSDSCCGGGFSSSEAESIYSSRSSRPKPIRTSVSSDPPKISSSVSPRKSSNSRFEIHQEEKNNCVPQQKPKNGNGFIKTKSRALKIYGDLKKVKQPISPGGKLASFINSLFTAGSPKKPKFSTSLNGGHDHHEDDRKSKSGYSTSTTTCSSASSFSRSCLSSKTPSSSTRIKRSVRFYPVSVIVDEDCRPCGHKSLYEDEPGLMAVTTTTTVSRKMAESPLMINEELKFHIMEKNRRVEEAARDLLKGYQKKKTDYEMRDVGNVKFEDEDEEDEDDDDAASYSSSDLFELDHLGTMGGIERYREELPVYETTHFDTNRAIANGLIL